MNSQIWYKRPWRWTITQISPALTLVDGTQDYSAPTNIYRLLRARITRTDETPNRSYPLDITDQLEPELVPQSYLAMRRIAMDYPTGQLRLESAVSVPTGMLLQIDGDYQPHPTKIVTGTMATNFWFPDQYFPVMVEGVKWKIYQLSDDPRAGNVVINPKNGNKQATGQLAIYLDALDGMCMVEDESSAAQLIYPSEPMGAGRVAWDIGRWP